MDSTFEETDYWRFLLRNREIGKTRVKLDILTDGLVSRSAFISDAPPHPVSFVARVPGSNTTRFQRAVRVDNFQKGNNNTQEPH